MNRTEQVELTTVCLIYSGDKILLQNRAKEDWKGYALPGGHVEAGESIVAATIREMREETGLTIQNPRLCGIKQFPTESGRYIVFLFKTDEFTGKLVSSDEGEMEWVKRGELASYQTVDNLEDMLRVMEDDVLSEFQYVVEDDVWKVQIY